MPQTPQTPPCPAGTTMNATNQCIAPATAAAPRAICPAGAGMTLQRTGGIDRVVPATAASTPPANDGTGGVLGRRR